MLLLAMAAAGCLQRRAALEVSTREIDFGSQLNSASFTVKNAGRDGLLTAGVSALEYDISVDRDWLTIAPASGRCGGGQQNTHVVEIDRALLLLGNNIGTILISSNDGPWSITVRADNILTTCTDPPTEPWNPTPGNGAIEVPIGADLVWSDGASRCPGLRATYDIYFGSSSPPPLVRDNGSSKSWDPGTLASGTTYYWRIVAKDANGSTSGAEWNFTTSEAPCTAGPNAVTLVAPGNGATSVSIDQDLSWGSGTSQCPGLTATYDVHFGTSTPPPFDHNNGSSKSWDPGTLANGTTYYWQVVAKDANGSTPGPVWSFTTSDAPCTAGPNAVTLVAPGNGATSVSIGQDLSWGSGDSQCPGLTATYDVHFGTSTPPPFDHNNGSSKSWDPGTLANGTTYYWQVVAKDANGSTPGPVWSFTTSDAPCTAGPNAVTLVAPGNGATSVSIGQDLSWGSGDSQCPGLTATYDVHFGTSAPPPFDHDNGSSKSWDPGTLANETTYYWQIVAKDANGSTPGPVWSFTTELPCLAMPTAACTPSPADEADNVNENANLAWGCGDSQCSGLVATYDVYFGTDPTPGPEEFLGNTAARVWDLPRQAKDTTFYWQIVTRDANGSSPGPVWRFTTRD